MGQPSGEGGVGAAGAAAGDLSPLCLGWRTQREVRPERAPSALLPPPSLLPAAAAAKCRAILQAWGCSQHTAVPAACTQHCQGAWERCC